jgi:hypothetical protein
MQNSNTDGRDLKSLYVFMAGFAVCVLAAVLLLLFTGLITPLVVNFQNFFNIGDFSLAVFLFILVMPLILFAVFLAAYIIFNFIKERFSPAKPVP